MASNLADDESDSCFEFMKQRHLARLASSPPSSDQQPQKQQHVPTTVVPIRVVSIKHKIERIAENLKAKNEMRQVAMPKVVHVDCNRRDDKLKSSLSAKQLAHQLILLRCKNRSNSDLCEEETDLTSLSWLTSFTLPSPPPSPPSQNNLLHHSTISTLIQPFLANSRQKPPFSFACLAFLAIEASARQRLSVKEVYTWITLNFPYYRLVPSGSWKNSIRHNLALNNTFSKVDKNLLAMRDFSGKGSLWCVRGECRGVLLDALDKSTLLQMSQLQDLVEHSKSSSLTPHITILNPRLAPKAKTLTDLDAVNALLSMKSRSSSMPPPITQTNKQGRRKQVFKPPAKKPHLNPKLLQDNIVSDPFFYNDNLDEDEDIEEEFDDDEFMDVSSEITPIEAITTSDDESKLEIDESVLTELTELNTTESNESNLEPGEIPKSNSVNEECPTKKARLDPSVQQTRATRSTHPKIPALPLTTLTRSATSRKRRTN